MPMKKGRLPLKHIIVRDLKRGLVGMTAKEVEYQGTLQLAKIPQDKHPELLPNDPRKTHEVTFFNLPTKQWVTIEIETLDNYEPRMSLDVGQQSKN